MQRILISCRVDPGDWETFKRTVHETDPEVSASHALRELMRWYASGCGRLRLTIPVVFPDSQRDGMLSSQSKSRSQR